MSYPDRRKRLIAVVAHCILNQNTVVKPLATHEGAVKSLVSSLIEQGYGIVQLPCPEALYLGMRRWWMSKEQYDTATYKEFSRKLLEPYVALLRELTRDGCRYVVIGVHGSPSCAAETTTSNPYWGGKPGNLHPASVKVKSPGVFMETLLEMVKSTGIPGPIFLVDIDHREISEKGLSRDLLEMIVALASTLNT